MPHVERFQDEVLAVAERGPFACLHGNDLGIAELLLADPFEHGLGLDPGLRAFADFFGQVVDAVALYAHHLAQAVVTHEAAGVVAVRMREEHVVERNGRERAFAHVDAEVELRELQVCGESRNRESLDGGTGHRPVYLLQRVVYVLACTCHVSTGCKSRKKASAPSGAEARENLFSDRG